MCSNKILSFFGDFWYLFMQCWNSYPRILNLINSLFRITELRELDWVTVTQKDLSQLLPEVILACGKILSHVRCIFKCGLRTFYTFRYRIWCWCHPSFLPYFLYFQISHMMLMSSKLSSVCLPLFLLPTVPNPTYSLLLKCAAHALPRTFVKQLVRFTTVPCAQYWSAFSDPTWFRSAQPEVS